MIVAYAPRYNVRMSPRGYLSVDLARAPAYCTIPTLHTLAEMRPDWRMRFEITDDTTHLFVGLRLPRLKATKATFVIPITLWGKRKYDLTVSFLMVEKTIKLAYNRVEIGDNVYSSHTNWIGPNWVDTFTFDVDQDWEEARPRLFKFTDGMRDAYGFHQPLWAWSPPSSIVSTATFWMNEHEFPLWVPALPSSSITTKKMVQVIDQVYEEPRWRRRANRSIDFIFDMLVTVLLCSFGFLSAIVDTCFKSSTRALISTFIITFILSFTVGFYTAQIQSIKLFF